MRKAVTKFLVFLLLAISILSCTAVSYIPKYTPKLYLDISPKTINKSVQIDRFKDASPAEDKIPPFMGGVSVTGKKSLSGELELEVTNAVVSDFSASGLFKEAGQKVENPDFIIKGEIKKFCGKSRTNTFAKIMIIPGIVGSIAGLVTFFANVKNPWRWFSLMATPEFSFYLGVPMSRNTSEIVIEMRLYDNHNKLINTYTGTAIDSSASLMYYDRMLTVSNMTNRVFSKVIMQIRDQILRDMSHE